MGISVASGFLGIPFAAFVTSFGVETVQLIAAGDIFRWTNITTNVLGAVIGYVIFWLLHHMIQGFHRPDLRR